MKINWLGYYYQQDGYGRLNSRLVQALQKCGVELKPATLEHLPMPLWLQEQEGLDWNALTLSCMPPMYLQPVPGRHWLYTMTEGSVAPESWIDAIHRCNIERLVVPCEHNKLAFEQSGVNIPVHVVPLGVDPVEFPYTKREIHRPYTFITLADRGDRKGWKEVWDAFYLAFGGKTTGTQDVKLIIKCLPHKEPTVPVFMSKAQDADRRIVYQVESVSDMAQVYAQADCLVLPSRSEGWGMPHREAASLGLPVIVQDYSGLAEEHLQEWAWAAVPGRLAPIPKEVDNTLGEWRVADVQSLAKEMRTVYEHPELARDFGKLASRWLHQNQTWMHTAIKLVRLYKEYKTTHGLSVERAALPLAV